MDRTFIRITLAAVVAAATLTATSLGPDTRLVIGLLAGVPSLALMITGRIQLGRSFAVRPEAKALVTKGLYAKLLHPMYIFLDLTLASLFVIIGWSPLFIAWGILVIVQALRARQEEKVLAAAFGAAYEEYRRRTWL